MSFCRATSDLLVTLYSLRKNALGEGSLGKTLWNTKSKGVGEGVRSKGKKSAVKRGGGDIDIFWNS